MRSTPRWRVDAKRLLRSAVRRLPGRAALRALAFRTGAIKYWWRYRHLIDGSYHDAPPPSTYTDPHREQLWSLVLPFSPSALVEVGCGDGANLALFARNAPTLRLSAIDVNPLALGIAQQRVRASGGTVGTFEQGFAERLPFPDASADVTLSDAVFMYLPPDTAVAALREMRRVATQAIVVHTFSDDALAASAVVGGNWVHNLPALIARAVPGARVNRQPSALVTSPQWRDFGAAFVVTW